ncbi:ethanolamine ammonia-lyase subunit EutC [Sporosarcina sp. Te-1]|uniref:ethanolamine ammonia-lyase subunit EutC n=1 Tax=Sporosarcina sp. Te-1 TaxID=2818390 RepID=UPI001A9F4DF4|nr:ethanolamine ammonia-lyase subunit EutC [Sporosarcina sp. Te-1]QTD40507.1 ethanolamine ammonia-lyase subunit EutC [Sporosarcina sp. Te-1]
MNEQLIEQITKMVVEKLQETKGLSETRKSDETMPVNLFAITPVGRAVTVENPETGPAGAVTFHRTAEQKQPAATPSKITATEACKKQDTKKQSDGKETELAELRKKTPARVGVGRAGSRPKTKTWLQFRLDHAAAVDAVYGEVPDELLSRLDLFQVHSKVADKEEYIRRPDLGRRLSDESKQTVMEKCKKGPTVQIVASNGLSAKAIEENLEDVYLSLEQSLRNLNIDMGTTFYVDKGRVALMDEIGEMLQPDVVVMLIGERPGLVSAESLSAYLCYQPRIGTIEADRMVISNIHKGGIPPVEAGAYLGTVIQKVLKYEASGVSLVNKEG